PVAFMYRECNPLQRASAERLQRSTDQREAYPGCACFARDPGLWLSNAFSVEEEPPGTTPTVEWPAQIQPNPCVTLNGTPPGVPESPRLACVAAAADDGRDANTADYDRNGRCCAARMELGGSRSCWFPGNVHCSGAMGPVA